MKRPRHRACNCHGRADPFGLLIAAVLLAVSLTILVQAQASAPDGASFSSVTASWSFGQGD
jgi:hypothetical protein